MQDLNPFVLNSHIVRWLCFDTRRNQFFDSHPDEFIVDSLPLSRVAQRDDGRQVVLGVGPGVVGLDDEGAEEELHLIARSTEVTRMNSLGRVDHLVDLLKDVGRFLNFLSTMYLTKVE